MAASTYNTKNLSNTFLNEEHLVSDSQTTSNSPNVEVKLINDSWLNQYIKPEEIDQDFLNQFGMLNTPEIQTEIEIMYEPMDCTSSERELQNLHPILLKEPVKTKVKQEVELGDIKLQPLDGPLSYGVKKEEVIPVHNPTIASSRPEKRSKPSKTEAVSQINQDAKIVETSLRHFEKYSAAIKETNEILTQLRNLHLQVTKDIDAEISFSALHMCIPATNKKLIYLHFVSKRVNFTIPLLQKLYFRVMKGETTYLEQLLKTILENCGVTDKFTMAFRDKLCLHGNTHRVCMLFFADEATK